MQYCDNLRVPCRAVIYCESIIILQLRIIAPAQTALMYTFAGAILLLYCCTDEPTISNVQD